MTTKLLTGLLAKPNAGEADVRCTPGERAFQIAFGAVQWPWLLRSLYGGTQAQKTALLARLGLQADALPHLGSWKADTYLLHRIVDIVETDVFDPNALTATLEEVGHPYELVFVDLAAGAAG